MTQFNRFYLDWAAFQASGETWFTLASRPPILAAGRVRLAARAPGCAGRRVFDDFRLLYFSNGYGDLDEATWGIHVFEPSLGTGAECGAAGEPLHGRAPDRALAQRFRRVRLRIQRHATTYREEPEGLTFWDLDADGRAPGLRGQLHAVLLDNDLLTADDVYVKHYRLSLEDTSPPVITCPADRRSPSARCIPACRPVTHHCRRSSPGDGDRRLDPIRRGHDAPAVFARSAPRR